MVYNSILFSSPLVLQSNLDLHGFASSFFLCPQIISVNQGKPVQFAPDQLRAYCPNIYTVYSGPKKAHNDMAIIILENDFTLDRHIDTICLPSRVDKSEISFEDCIATGM